MIKILLTVSIAINLVLGSLYLLRLNESDSNKVNDAQGTGPDFKITSAKNFESVFIDKNDSTYNRIWSEAFENQPEMALLISCTYYCSTGDNRALENIKTSRSQLEIMYDRSISQARLP